jgi:hypothetical protein
MIQFTDAIVTDPFYQDTRLFTDVSVCPDILAEFGVDDPRDADAKAKDEFVRMFEKFSVRP